MIDSYRPHIFKSEIKKLIKDEEINSLDEFINIIFDENSEFVIKSKYQKIPKTTFLNRFNLLWFYPLFILSIPFTYLFFGSFHVSEDSETGKIIIKLIGKYN